MGLLETMKQVAQATNDAGMPTAFLFGSVTKTSPLTIRVDNRFDISYDRIEITVPKGDREKIVQAASAAGMSVNAFIKEALVEYIARTTKQ